MHDFEILSPSTRQFLWVRNPFLVKDIPDKMTSQDFESLLDITFDISFKQKLEEVSLTEFWCSLLQEYPAVSKLAVLKLLPFPTTYMCEVGFSRYAVTKTKYCKRLNVSSDMRIQVSNISPNFWLSCYKIK
jgi:hypothetical protein